MIQIITMVWCLTHLESDILECEVKWALGSITTNKVIGGDEIPVELFQILKDDAVKSCSQYASKFGKLSSGHRTGKGHFHSNPEERQCQRMLKLKSIESKMSFSVIPFSSCLHSFPASRSFPMSQYFVSGDQSTCCGGLLIMLDTTV